MRVLQRKVAFGISQELSCNQGWPTWSLWNEKRIHVCRSAAAKRSRRLGRGHVTWTNPQRNRMKVVAVGEDGSEGPLLEKLDLNSTGGLDGTSVEVFGPLAVALVGFSQTEFCQFRDLLQQMDAEFVKTIPCSAAHLDLSLQTVLHLESVEFDSGPLGLRRTVFLSGMYAAEIQEIISAYRDAQMPPAVFAAYVPKNKDKILSDLVDEVYDDHQYMIQQRQRSIDSGDVSF